MRPLHPMQAVENAAVDGGPCRRRIRGSGAAAALLALLLLYALSPGPLQILLYSNPGHPGWLESTCDIVYAPIDWACDRFKPVDDFYAWYEGGIFDWWWDWKNR